jgi:hypothetical protein
LLKADSYGVVAGTAQEGGGGDKQPVWQLLVCCGLECGFVIRVIRIKSVWWRREVLVLLVCVVWLKRERYDDSLAHLLLLLLLRLRLLLTVHRSLRRSPPV